MPASFSLLAILYTIAASVLRRVEKLLSLLRIVRIGRAINEPFDSQVDTCSSCATNDAGCEPSPDTCKTTRKRSNSTDAYADIYLVHVFDFAPRIDIRIRMQCLMHRLQVPMLDQIACGVSTPGKKIGEVIEVIHSQ